MLNNENLMERSPVPMAELDGPDHVMRYVNPAFCRLLGKSKAVLTGKRFAETMQEKNGCLALLDRVYRTGEPETHTEAGRPEPDSPYWSYAMWPVLDAGQRPVSVIMQVTETTQFHQQTGAMNEALLLSSVRQHELTEAAEKLGDQLGAEIIEHKRAEQALRAGEEQFRRSIEHAPIPVIMQAEDGHVLEISQAWTKLTGCTREEMEMLAAKLNRAYGHGAGAVREHVRGLFADQSSIEPTEFEIKTRAGESRCWIFSAWPVGTLLDGRRYIVGTALDVTDRKQAEEALRESEENYRTLFDSIDEGFCTIEVLFKDNKPVDYRFLEVNPAFARQTGIENAMGKRMREIAPQHEEYWFETYGKIALTGEPLRFQSRAEQLHRSYDVYAFRIGEPSERKVAILFDDITERERTVEALRESEERFRAIFNQTTGGVAQTDLSGRFVLVNERYCGITGRSREELLQLRMHDITHPDDLPGNGEKFRALAAGYGENFVIENRYLRPDGSAVWVRNHVSAIRDADGKVRYIAAAVTDTTEHKLAEERLRESEQRFARFMQRLPGLAWIKDIQGRYVYANDAALKSFRASRAELYSKADDELFPRETATQFKENDHRALASESGVQEIETLQHEDGVVHHSLVSKFPIPGPDGKLAFIGGMAIDVTERIQAEEALRESEERYRLLVEGTPDYAMFLIDPLNIIVYWSAGAEKVFGWSAEEAIGQNGNLIFTLEDRALKQEEKERAIALRDGHAPDRRWHMRKDGSRTWVDGVMRRLDDDEGNLRGFAKVAREATEQRNTELSLEKSAVELDRRVRERTAELSTANQKLQEQIEERSKLEQEILLISEREKRRIGQDLHDSLCQELAAAALFLKSDAQKIAKSHPEQARTLLDAAKIVNANVGVARDLARGLHPVELNASGLTNALRELCYSHSGPGMNCQFQCPAAIRMRDNSVALNLYRIAQQAMNNAVRHGKPRTIVVSLKRTRAGLTLMVKDDGVGLPTHRSAKGMGLDIMHYRANAIGAKFSLDSRRGRGTTVTCVLPRA